MRPKQPAHERPPFLDFFPPMIDGALMALLYASTPGRPEREALSPGALAEQRFLALDALERMKPHGAHEQAERVAREAVAEGRPFGLYLRNFGLSGRVSPGPDDEHGYQRVLTVSSGHDVNMQNLLAEPERAAVPFVAIANPALDAGPVPRLVISDEHWERAAETLIGHAAVVVMYFLTSSPGVAREIDLLRAAGAVGRTLVVVADEAPQSESTEQLARALYGGAAALKAFEAERGSPARDVPAAAARTPPPPDFPHQIVIGNEPEDWRRVAEALDSMLLKAVPSPRRELPPLPPAARPGPQALALAHSLALAEYDEGVRRFKERDGVAAEDAFIRSIAYSHWSRDPFGRALAFTQLGNVERFLLKYPNEAVSAYFLALDLLESLLPSSQMASQGYEPFARSLAAYLEELGAPDRARHVLDRLAKRKEHGESPPAL